MQGNTKLLTNLCATLPAITMAAAHWFPWRRIFKRNLHRLEAYTIGTTAIVGTAALAMASSTDGDGKAHSRMLLCAAAGAGLTTIVSYAVDQFIEMRAEIAGLKAERDHLNSSL